MQHDGRHAPQAEPWPSFLGAPTPAEQPPAYAAHPPVDGSGFRLPNPPQLAAGQQPAHPQFQYAPSPQAHQQAPPGYEAPAGYPQGAPADDAHSMHQPAGHAPGYASGQQMPMPPHQPYQQPQAHADMYAHGQPATAQHAGSGAPGGQPLATQPFQHGSAAVAMSPAAAPQTFIAADGRTYAYATPQGFDLMQGAHARASASAVAAAAPPQAPTGVRRMRWETIIPAAAAVLLLCTIGLFVLKFDAITGRDQLPAATAQTTEPEAVQAPSAEDQAAALEQARTLANLGRYDEAKAMVDPLLAVKTPLDGVAAVSSQIETSSARNDELLTVLGKQRQAGSWMGVVTTIGQIKALRPLTTDLVTIRNGAQARVNAAQRAKKRAKVTAAAKRRAAVAKQRAASTRTVSSSAPRSVARPGATARASSATPPARVGSGAMPPRPSVANTGSAPTGGITGGQPAVTAGGGGSCHTHDGVTECH